MSKQLDIENYGLKLISEQDCESFYILIQNNIQRLEDYFAGTVARTKTLEDTRHYCGEIEKKIANNVYYPYLIIDNKTNLPLGLIDVKNIDWNIPKGELGAFIDSSIEGKGIVTHLVKKLILQIVKEHNFKKLFCRVAPKNNRSIRVVERLGFILEGTIQRDYRTTKGELVDLNYYGRIFD